MKFIGLLLLIVACNAMGYGVTSTQILLALIGLAFLFSDVIFYAMKKEIDHRHRNRRR